MSTSAIMKKRTNIFIITVIFIIVGLITTYFIFSNSNKDVLINNKNIKVIFENSKEGLKFGEYPMTFQQGISESPSNIFKIVNKSKFSTDYQVIVTNTSKEGNSIDVNKVAVSINDSEIKMLSDVVNGIVYTSSLASKSEDIVNLKFWLDKDSADDADLSKSIKLSVDIKEK